MAMNRVQFQRGLAMAEFLERYSSDDKLSDGLWCFRGIKLIGAEHQPTATGSGKAGAKLAQFKAVNTLLSDLKTAFTSTYHAFDFAKYAHRATSPRPNIGLTVASTLSPS
jgi:hypothetical protein